MLVTASRHRDPAVYKDPDTFNPWRWKVHPKNKKKDKKKKKNHNKYIF